MLCIGEAGFFKSKKISENLGHVTDLINYLIYNNLIIWNVITVID